MKKKPSYGVLVERIKLAVISNCAAGGERTRKMWEFAARYGDKPKSVKFLESECRRIIDCSLRPDNARRVLTALLSVKQMTQEQVFSIVGFPKASRESLAALVEVSEESACLAV